MRFLGVVAACLLLNLFGVAHSAKINYGKYPFSRELNGRYKLYWKRIQADDKNPAAIQIALDVQATGWVGFGIGEFSSGGMAGADMFVASVDEKGEASGLDMHALGQVMPGEDDCQDWELLNGYETKDGHTIIEFKRNLNTTDLTNDRPIQQHGDTRVVWAFHDTSDALTYHGSLNRGMAVINFWSASTAKEPIEDIKSNAANRPLLLANNYTLTNATRQYTETVFKWFDIFPADSPTAWIVAIEAAIESIYVHHFVLYTCPATTANAEGVQTCAPATRRFLWTGGAYAGSTIVFPANVGFKVAPDPENNIFVLQTHYFNDRQFNHIGTDVSGVRLWYTTTPVANDAGSLALGDPLIQQIDTIDAHDTLAFEYSCPSQCTMAFGQNMKVIFDRHLIRDIGKEMWTTQWRTQKKKESQIAVVNRVQFANYDLVHENGVSYEIHPGDRLNTHCIFDNNKPAVYGGVVEDRRFGPVTPNEACIHYMIYYPRLPLTKRGLENCGLMVEQGYKKHGCTEYSSPDFKEDGNGGEGDFGTPPGPTVCPAVIGKKILKFIKEHPAETAGGLIFLFIVLGGLIAGIVVLVLRKYQMKRKAKQDFAQVVGTDFAKDSDHGSSVPLEERS